MSQNQLLGIDVFLASRPYFLAHKTMAVREKSKDMGIKEVINPQY